MKNTIFSIFVFTSLGLICVETEARDAVEVARAVPSPKVVVIGAQKSPNAIAYTNQLSVGKVILLSGGYSQFANKTIFLIRNATAEKLDFKSIVEDPKNDILLKAWDTIVIE